LMLVILYFGANFIAVVTPFDLACVPLRMHTFSRHPVDLRHAFSLPRFGG
jgi:hypothetical protein